MENERRQHSAGNEFQTLMTSSVKKIALVLLCKVESEIILLPSILHIFCLKKGMKKLRVLVFYSMLNMKGAAVSQC